MDDPYTERDDLDVNLTLSERVARASGSSPAVPQGDGTILIELTLHRLEPSALPRPRRKKGLLHRMRRGLTGASGGEGQIRYVKTRHGDPEERP